MKNRFFALIAAVCLVAFFASSAMAAEKMKFGFLVKQPEEPWFQTEWAFADKAGAELGIEIIKIAVPDGEKTLIAIDTLASAGAQGFIICVPDTKLGPAVKRKADNYGMKVIAVDDQLVDAKGQPLTSVPIVMMAAKEIGARQGELLYKEMQDRGWKLEDTAVMAITADELETARLRTSGSIEALQKAGFPDAKIYRAPTKTNDIPGALDAGNALLAQHPEVKNWLILGMNDNTVLGGVRATESQRIPVANVVGIGINGVDAVNELGKTNPTGFLGSLLPAPDVHGYKTVYMLNDWIVNGVVPPEFTAVGDPVLLTRENFKEELARKGL